MKLMKVLIPAVALLIMAAACSSPAVTGIKVHIQNSEYQEAIHLADSVLAGPEADNPEVWYWRGRAYSMMRNWEGSAESFQMAYRLDPQMQQQISSYWPAFYNTATAYASEGRREEAVEMLETGKSIVPERPEFDQLLGQMALNAGDHEQALEYFETSLGLAREMIVTLQRSIANATDPVIAEQLQEQYDRTTASIVLSSYNAGAILKNFYLHTEDQAEASDYMDRAVDIYLKAIEADPSNADIMTGLAELYILSEQYDEALSIYDNALVAIENGVEEGWIPPEDADEMRAGVLLTRGFTLIEMERYEEGINELQECRATMGDTYQVLAMIGHAHFVMENYETSLETMKMLAEREGLTAEEYANAWYMIYANYIRLEKDTEALAAIQAAIQYQATTPTTGSTSPRHTAASAGMPRQWRPWNRPWSSAGSSRPPLRI